MSEIILSLMNHEPGYLLLPNARSLASSNSFSFSSFITALSSFSHSAIFSADCGITFNIKGLTFLLYY